MLSTWRDLVIACLVSSLVSCSRCCSRRFIFYESRFSLTICIAVALAAVGRSLCSDGCWWLAGGRRVSWVDVCNEFAMSSVISRRSVFSLSSRRLSHCPVQPTIASHPSTYICRPHQRDLRDQTCCWLVESDRNSTTHARVIAISATPRHRLCNVSCLVLRGLWCLGWRLIYMAKE